MSDRGLVWALGSCRDQRAPHRQLRHGMSQLHDAWPPTRSQRQCSWGGSAGCESAHLSLTFLLNQRAIALRFGRCVAPDAAWAVLEMVGAVDQAPAPPQACPGYCCCVFTPPQGALCDSSRLLAACSFICWGWRGRCSLPVRPKSGFQIGLGAGTMRGWGAGRNGRCRAASAATATFALQQRVLSYLTQLGDAITHLNPQPSPSFDGIAATLQSMDRAVHGTA